MSLRKPAVIAYTMKINDTGKNKTAHLLLKQTVEISFSVQVTFQLIDCRLLEMLKCNLFFTISMPHVHQRYFRTFKVQQSP